MCRMKTVGLLKPIQSTGLNQFLLRVGECFNVSFKVSTTVAGIDAWFISDFGPDEMHFIANAERPCFAIADVNGQAPCGLSPFIQLSSNINVPSILRGHQLGIDNSATIRGFPRLPREVDCLACKDGIPVWAIVKAKGIIHHLISFSLPEITDGTHIFDHIHGVRFSRTLPLILFLQKLNGHSQMESPPLQSCFIFDDPNLHWNSYGFINFRELCTHARDNRYHVSFATIPLDSWFVHPPTASLFTNNTDQMSLLIHGNNHTERELAEQFSEVDCSLLIAQALERVARLEARTGLHIPRIVVPPHGACSHTMLSQMAHAGIEAVCVSWGSLQYYNHKANWIKDLGVHPSAIVADMTVLPRFRLSQTCHDDILFAAFFNQPIALVGHHSDLKEGLEVLGRLSGFINSLGPVRWTNMQNISRSHFSRHSEGETLFLYMHTKRICISVPDGIFKILPQGRWMGALANEFLMWRASSFPEWLQVSVGEPIAVQPGQFVEIASKATSTINKLTPSGSKTPIWPFCRRQLAEARDRIQPLLYRICQ